MTTFASAAKSSILPNFYLVRERSIPSRLTLRERETFARGLGVPAPQAAVIAMQDRASAMACVLAKLVCDSGDAALIARAQAAVDKWNKECDEFFRV